jgi:hypothetical protein
MSVLSACGSLSLGSKKRSHRQRREKRNEFKIKSEISQLRVVKKRNEINSHLAFVGRPNRNKKAISLKFCNWARQSRAQSSSGFYGTAAQVSIGKSRFAGRA